MVYRADDNGDLLDDLYSVDVVGGSPKRLNPDLVTSGSVTSSEIIAPDSSRVVCVADQEVDEKYELWVADQGTAAASFLGDSLIASEGETSDVTVVLDDARVIPVEVDYALTGGSATPADFAMSDGTLTFPPGVISRTFAFTVVDDGLVDGDDGGDLTHRCTERHSGRARRSHLDPT